jgi:hypothetical protein
MRAVGLIGAAALLAGLAVLQPSAARTPVAQPASKQAALLSPAWLTRQHDNTRTGYDPTEPTTAAITNLWTAHTAGNSTTLDGQLYGTPLLYGNSVYVATENDVLYAFNTATGNEQWHLKLATPRNASTLPCGNISPNVGITSTPVIDPNAAGGHGVIYMAAMTYEPHYRLYGVDLVTHGVVMNTIIDAGRVAVENQRAALTLANGNVYIPYGGRAGDCFDTDGTPYYAIVVGVPQNGGTHFSFAATDTEGAGIWGPGGPSADASGNLYVALGNGSGPKSESVIKLSPGLTMLKQWRPSNHALLDSIDADVGSDTPGLVGSGNVFQNGKYGHAFLLNSNLTQLTADPGVVACNGLTSAASYGAVAYKAPYIYAPCANGLYAWDETTLSSSSTPLWHSLTTFAGSPIIAGGLVWTLSSGSLYGFNPATGATVTSISVGGFSRFQSPVTGAGRMFVAGTNYLKAYNMVGGCDTASISATPATMQAAGTSVALDGTAGGPNCSTPTFEWWIRYPDMKWRLARTFNTTAAFTWDTTGLRPGTYVIHLWANQSGGQTSTYEALDELIYTLTGCSTAGLAPPTVTQVVASTVDFTASSTGCSTAVYEYWVQLLDNKWYMKRAFSTTATWGWDTTGLRPGTYKVHVWANNQGAYTGLGDKIAESVVTLTGCASASLLPSSGSTHPGTPVLFTASSGGCPMPVYEFWIQDTTGRWHRMTGFGGNTWTWNNAGWGKGVYHIHVWANQQGSETRIYQAIGAATYTLT